PTLDRRVVAARRPEQSGLGAEVALRLRSGRPVSLAKLGGKKVTDNERLTPANTGTHRESLSCKEFERLGHEVRVELEHRTVPGIGVDDEVAIGKAPRQVVCVLAWNHAITVAVCDQHRLVDL